MHYPEENPMHDPEENPMTSVKTGNWCMCLVESSGWPKQPHTGGDLYNIAVVHADAAPSVHGAEMYMQAAVEQKQALLRQAYKLTTDAEAKCKALEQQLAAANARCL